MKINTRHSIGDRVYFFHTPAGAHKSPEKYLTSSVVRGVRLNVWDNAITEEYQVWASEGSAYIWLDGKEVYSPDTLEYAIGKLDKIDHEKERNTET